MGYILLLCVIFSSCTKVEPDKRTAIMPISELPEVRQCGAMFAYKGKIYQFAGHDERGKYHNNMYQYSVENDSWSDLGETPLMSRVYPISVVVGDKAYIGLGYSGKGVNEDENYLVDFWQYEFETGSWLRLADYPSRKSNNTVCFEQNGVIYVGLGFHGFTNEFYCYNIESNTWSEAGEVANFPVRTTGSVAAQTQQRSFVGTGFRHESKTDWYEYFPDENKWKKRKNVPYKGRYNSAATAMDKSIYLFGGWHYGDSLTNGFYYDDILRYDIEEDKWYHAGTLPDGKLMNMQAVVASGEIYFGLGELINGEPKKQMYKLVY